MLMLFAEGGKLESYEEKGSSPILSPQLEIHLALDLDLFAILGISGIE